MTWRTQYATAPNLVALGETYVYLAYVYLGRTPKLGSAGVTLPSDGGRGWYPKKQVIPYMTCVNWSKAVVLC